MLKQAVIRTTSSSMAEWFCMSLLVLYTSLPGAISSGVEDVCQSEQFEATCGKDEVVVIDAAEYGRIEEMTRCHVTSSGGEIGCYNDVIHIADKECSGKKECQFIVGNTEFTSAISASCNRELRAYLRISYSCVKVVYHEFAHCLSQTRVPVNAREGFISSHVTIENGCGSTTSPWTITAKQGQTIELVIWDFATTSRGRNCASGVYGYIAEKSLGANESFCSGAERRRDLYFSKSNYLEIGIQGGSNSLFVIHFKVVGCSDLTPPAHAWYKRDGHVATIGCDESETQWELRCHGNSWEGVVGNCSAAPLTMSSGNKLANMNISVKTMLIVAAIAGGTIVLAVLIIVAGVVCIKKYRHESEMRACSLPGTLVYQAPPSGPGETPPRGQYHAMTMSTASPDTMAKPGMSTMGSVHHACTMVQRTPIMQRGMIPGRPSPIIVHKAQVLGTHNPMTSKPVPSRRPDKQVAPSPPTNRQYPNVHTQSRPLPQPGTSGSPSQRPLISVPEDDITTDFDGPGVYQNPDDIIGTASSSCLDPPQAGAAEDPDDISSYYAPQTGHKYFILERQPETQSDSQS